MAGSPAASTKDELLRELRRCAGWEDGPGAVAAARRLAALPDDDVPAVLVGELVVLDAVDLSEDAGDVGDELFRAREALEVGLVSCGSRAVSLLRPLIAGEASHAARVALRVLAELGDPEAIPVARRWIADETPEGQTARLVAIDALGRLRPPDAVGLLRGAIARAHGHNGGWLKRTAAHALGRLGDVEALESLLADPDWFARLGAAEALAKLPRGQGEAARQRACADPDARVALAARRN